MPVVAAADAVAASRLRIAMVTSGAPSAWGLEGFGVALERELRELGHDVVVGAGAALTSPSDVAIVQHAFDGDGGWDGGKAVDLLTSLRVPSILVLRVVPVRPSERQAELLVMMCGLASSVVVLSESARVRLAGLKLPIDECKVLTIPPGALLAGTGGPSTASFRSPRGRLLSWGLIGPGTGIEHAIDAVALLSRRGRPVGYSVTGGMDPTVTDPQDDSYRDSLMERARAKGVRDEVTFDDGYREASGMARVIASSSVVILPYDSMDTVSSPVLVESLAAGRPVIATAFPHAVELLGSGAGLVVPHRDPAALAEAIHLATADLDLLRSMTMEARRLAPILSWPRVAQRYGYLGASLATSHERVSA